MSLVDCVFFIILFVILLIFIVSLIKDRNIGKPIGSSVHEKCIFLEIPKINDIFDLKIICRFKRKKIDICPVNCKSKKVYIPGTSTFTLLSKINLQKLLLFIISIIPVIIAYLKLKLK